MSSIASMSIVPPHSPAVSVVIPILDEDVSALVRDVSHLLGGTIEFVIVNDGAPASVEGARVIDGTHHGKGRAVRDGVLATTGEVVVILDADLGILVPRIPEFVSLVRDGFDVVIAERKPDFHARHPARFVLSFGLLLFQRLIVFNSFRFTDTQCGLKAFRGDVARALASRQRVDGGMYDIEYLYIAVRNSMRIAKVPVGAVPELRPSRIHLWRCLRTDPAALLAVKCRGWLGRYRLNVSRRSERA